MLELFSAGPLSNPAEATVVSGLNPPQARRDTIQQALSTNPESAHVAVTDTPALSDRGTESAVRAGTDAETVPSSGKSKVKVFDNNRNGWNKSGSGGNKHPKGRQGYPKSISRTTPWLKARKKQVKSQHLEFKEKMDAVARGTRAEPQDEEHAGQQRRMFLCARERVFPSPRR